MRRLPLPLCVIRGSVGGELADELFFTCLLNLGPLSMLLMIRPIIIYSHGLILDVHED